MISLQDNVSEYFMDSGIWIRNIILRQKIHSQLHHLMDVHSLRFVNFFKNLCVIYILFYFSKII